MVQDRELTMTDERLDSLERWRDDMEKRFADTFQGSDHVGHCRYHTLMIEGIEERRKLRHAIQEKTIAGLAWALIAPGRIRRPGGGRKRATAKDPTLRRDLEQLVEPTTRGDPESPLR